MSRKMMFDFKNRINNLDLPKSKMWMALYEAIYNSIHAIQERDIKDGKVKVIIKRSNSLLEDDIKKIDTIEIIDNGIGFNKENFMSFLTSDSPYKQKIGGRGVGRLTWLKVFKKVIINSVFAEENKYYKRYILFSENGIENDYVKEIEKTSKIETSVKMINMIQPYVEESDIKSTEISDNLIQYLAPYLIANDNVEISILESESEDIVKLDFVFFNEYIRSVLKKEIYIDNVKFSLDHVFSTTKSNLKNNHIYISAQDRLVWDKNLDNYIGNLPSYYILKDEKVNYSCFIKSAFLDEEVTCERITFNNFKFDNKNSGFTGINGYESIISSIEDYLNEYINEFSKAKFEKIKNYILQEEEQYGYLFRNNEMKKEIMAIPSSIANNPQKLSSKIRDIDNEYYFKIKKRVETEIINDEDISKIASKIKDTSQKSLMEYIIRRKLIIETVAKKTKKNANNKYCLEKDIHRIIFPMNESLSTVNYDDHNLWLLDERLAFSYQAMSDMRMDKYVKNSKSAKRPDLIFINNFTSLETTDRSIIDSIYIVELKRPNRENMDDSPLKQILGYIEEIKKSNTLITPEGDIFDVDEKVTFECYIIGDPNHEMKQRLYRDNFTKILNGERWYYYHSQYNAKIEFISFKRMIKDAKIRNMIFERKLKIKDENE